MSAITPEHTGSTKEQAASPPEEELAYLPHDGHIAGGEHDGVAHRLTGPLIQAAHHVPAAKEHAPGRIDTPMKVVIASSFVLRLAGASTAIMLAAYLKQVVQAQTDLIGVLAALFYVTELFLAPIFGAISDVRGRRAILIMGPLMGAFALPIYPFSALTSISILSIGILAMARLIEGVSTAAKVPSALGYLADVTEGDSPEQTSLRGRVMGFYEITFLVGLVGGTILGGSLWQSLNEIGFYFIAFIYLAAAAMLFFFVPETLPVQARAQHQQEREASSTSAHHIRVLLKTRLKAYASLLKEPALHSFVPAWLAINAVVGVMGNLVQPVMIRPRMRISILMEPFVRVINFVASVPGTGFHHIRLVQVSDPFPNQMLDGKFTSTQVGFAFGALGLVFMIGIFIWSLLYGKIRKTDVMLIGIGGLFVVSAGLFAINNSLLPGEWGHWALVPLLAVGIFLVSGFTPVALAYLAEISSHRVEHRGAVMGLYSVFLGIGQLVGSGGGGIFVKELNQGFNGIVYAVVILGVISGFSILWLRVKHAV